MSSPYQTPSSTQNKRKYTTLEDYRNAIQRENFTDVSGVPLLETAPPPMSQQERGDFPAERSQFSSFSPLTMQREQRVSLFSLLGLHPSESCSASIFHSSGTRVAHSDPTFPSSEISVPFSAPMLALSGMRVPRGDAIVPLSEISVPFSTSVIPPPGTSVPCSDPLFPLSGISVPCSSPMFSLSGLMVPHSAPMFSPSEISVPFSASMLSSSGTRVPSTDPMFLSSGISVPCSSPIFSSTGLRVPRSAPMFRPSEICVPFSAPMVSSSGTASPNSDPMFLSPGISVPCSSPMFYSSEISAPMFPSSGISVPYSAPMFPSSGINVPCSSPMFSSPEISAPMFPSSGIRAPHSAQVFPSSGMRNPPPHQSSQQSSLLHVSPYVAARMMSLLPQHESPEVSYPASRMVSLLPQHGRVQNIPAPSFTPAVINIENPQKKASISPVAEQLKTVTEFSLLLNETSVPTSMADDLSEDRLLVNSYTLIDPITMVWNTVNCNTINDNSEVDEMNNWWDKVFDNDPKE